MLDIKKRALLSQIMKEYIKTARPIGSLKIGDKLNFSVSPATIRNQMAQLEKEGYVYQPHTSAGRIPTEKGWHFYLKNFIRKKELSKREHKILLRIRRKYYRKRERMVKEIAKTLASLARELVVINLSPNYVYYTGLSYLFTQPEFKNIPLQCSVAYLLDDLERFIEELDKMVSFDLKILIGRKNPLGRQWGTILTRYRCSKRFSGLLALLGPIRMDYEKNIARLKFAQKLLNSL